MTKKNAYATKIIAEDSSSAMNNAETYVLRLYIAGSSPRSTRAVMNIKEICENALSDHYDLEVIDIYQQPNMARGQQIVAAPTLIKELPPPVRKFIGDMSNTDKILVGLALKLKG